MDAVRLFNTVDLRDVRVIKGREQLRLTVESRKPLGVAGKEFGQDLDGDIAIQLVSRAR